MSKHLGPKAGYIEILNHFTQEQLVEELEDPKKWMPLRPSAAGKCTRELAHELMEYRGLAKYEKKPKDNESHRLLNLGHSIEWHAIKQFKDAFKRAGIDIKYQQQSLSFFKLPDAEIIEGRIDGTFMSKTHGALIDIKSKKDKFSAWVKTDWLYTDEKLRENKYVTEFGEHSFYIDDLAGFLKGLKDPFWASNFYQLNLYFFDEHRFLRERGIDHAALIYYNKNDSRMREIRFRPSEEVFKEIKDKFLSVHEAVDVHKDPTKVQKDYMLGSIKCAFCPFSKQCWGDKDALKEYFYTWPKKKWPTKTTRLEYKLRNELEGCYSDYQTLQQNNVDLKTSEDEIVELLEQNKIQKVQFKDGKIFELKALKSGGSMGGPRIVFRRGKL